jgi:hypothetical protein
MEVSVLQYDQAVCCIVAAAEAAPVAMTTTKARPTAAVSPRDEQVVVQLDLDLGVASKVALHLKDEGKGNGRAVGNKARAVHHHFNTPSSSSVMQL